MPRFRFRGAITGRWVTALFAKLWPWITVREREEDFKIGGTD